MPRTFAFGDIHGCLSLLNTLLATLKPTPDDTLIFLGDMIDRGPDSKGVIDRIIALEQYCNVIAIGGNHEEMMLGSLSQPEYIKYWLRYGGDAALASFGLVAEASSVDQIPVKYRQWLSSLVAYFETEDFIFCHASPSRDIPIAAQQDDLRWRVLDNKDGRHLSGKTIICGHSEQRSGKVYQQEGLICIDTFAYGGGNLTALEIVNNASGRVWQVSDHTAAPTQQKIIL